MNQSFFSSNNYFDNNSVTMPGISDQAHMGTFISIIAISISVLFLLFAEAVTIHAQTSSPLRSSTTNNGVADVLLDFLPSPLENKSKTEFKVTFVQPSTDKVQPHIDYDFIIFNDDKEIFSASKEAGEGPSIHTNEGIVTISYKFQHAGSYTIDIPITGWNFIPLDPKHVKFPIIVIS